MLGRFHSNRFLHHLDVQEQTKRRLDWQFPWRSLPMLTRRAQLEHHQIRRFQQFEDRQQQIAEYRLLGPMFGQNRKQEHRYLPTQHRPLFAPFDRANHQQ